MPDHSGTFSKLSDGSQYVCIQLCKDAWV